MRKAVRVIPYLVLLLWTLFLYFPAISEPFVYDDKFQVINNPHIQNFHAATEYLRLVNLVSRSAGADAARDSAPAAPDHTAA